MFNALADLLGEYLRGAHGASGRAQGVVVALALGLVCLKCICIGVAVALFFWRQFIRPAKDLKKYGSWAAVTGATDGIGRAYCDELAKQGVNVLLVSRTESKLAAAAEEISTKYGVQTKVVAVDLVAAGNAPYEGPEWGAFKAKIAPLEIGVLINNAGQAQEPAFLHETTAAEIDDIVAINCSAMVKATRAVLPGMLARGKGAIVNISSLAGTPVGCPCLALYGASKAFVDHFSIGLSEDYTSQGIDIQVQVAAYVATKMSRMKPAPSTPSASRYAAAAVRHIGYEDHAVPYYKHALDRTVFQMPTPMQRALWKPMMARLRLKTLARRERKAETNKSALLPV